VENVYRFMEHPGRANRSPEFGSIEPGIWCQFLQLDCSLILNVATCRPSNRARPALQPLVVVA